MYFVLIFGVFLNLVHGGASGGGVLLLYRPRDITADCTDSSRLRYDISFGMGLSDTITLVFRTLSLIDYHCAVEIVAEEPKVFLIISMLYPTTLETNCRRHPEAVSVEIMDEFVSICYLVTERERSALYYKSVVRERIRIRFQSNSSINLDMRTHMYQLTATAARKLGNQTRCSMKNETECTMNKTKYCFTNGVVCDGIKNCGVPNWFDERLAECGVQQDTLGFPQVFALTAALLFAALSVFHLLAKCLPPLANSFFVFNANEDNRLCVDPVFSSPAVHRRDIHRVPRTSLVPVSSDTSSTDAPTIHEPSSMSLTNKTLSQVTELSKHAILRRTTAMRSMTVKLQERFKAVTKSRLVNRPEKYGRTSRNNDIDDV